MDPVSAINDLAFRLAASIASQHLNTAMVLLSWSPVIILSLIAIVLYRKREDNAVLFALSCVALYALGLLIKAITMEPRPCDVQDLSWINAVGCDPGYSLPSNHAMVLSGAYIFVKDYRYIQFAYPAWMLLVMLSRIYLGQHYFTDVLAGALLGVLIGYAIYKKSKRINKFLRRRL